MKFNKISRAYSTGVTQEFLQNILARAQEATAKKSVTGNKSAPKTNWRNSRKSSQRANRSSQNASNGNSDAQRRSPVGVVSSRMHPTVNHNIVNKQPQFQRKTINDGKNAALGDDLIDAFESTKSNTLSRARSKSTDSNYRRNNRHRDAPGFQKKSKDNNKRLEISAATSRVVQDAYVPQEPTPLSLLRFHADLPNTASSRLVNYYLDVMKSANFPLFRRLNYGVLTRAEEPPKNLAYNINTPFFGKYTPASSLILEREKLFKNLVMSEDRSKFDSMVSGKYQELKHLEKNQFSGLTKSDKKKQEFEYNADVVRRGLESSIVDQEIKENAYQVCTGLRHLSEL